MWFTCLAHVLGDDDDAASHRVASKPGNGLAGVNANADPAMRVSPRGDATETHRGVGDFRARHGASKDAIATVRARPNESHRRS
jgi:hypothetical protein